MAGERTSQRKHQARNKNLDLHSKISRVLSSTPGFRAAALNCPGEEFCVLVSYSVKLPLYRPAASRDSIRADAEGLHPIRLMINHPQRIERSRHHENEWSHRKNW